MVINTESAVAPLSKNRQLKHKWHTSETESRDLPFLKWMTFYKVYPVLSGALPRHGSFFTRNSSRAIQPPPTRTITVLRRIRTRRSCWESPNCRGRREDREEGEESLSTTLHQQHWTRLEAVQHQKPADATIWRLLGGSLSYCELVPDCLITLHLLTCRV